MTAPTASRTLVKSPPELWAEVSDAEVLARHLGEFGEVRITRLEPETTVVWEGDRASGTVELEPSGWGTKVTLRAELAEIEAKLPPPPPPPPPKPSFFARWFLRDAPVVVEQHIEEEVAEEPVAPDRAAEVLADVLDKLGAAHHRPFSRG